MKLESAIIVKEIRHFHFCCGIGGAAKEVQQWIAERKVKAA